MCSRFENIFDPFCNFRIDSRSRLPSKQVVSSNRHFYIFFLLLHDSPFQLSHCCVPCRHATRQCADCWCTRYLFSALRRFIVRQNQFPVRRKLVTSNLDRLKGVSFGKSCGRYFNAYPVALRAAAALAACVPPFTTQHRRGLCGRGLLQTLHVCDVGECV